MPFAPDRSLINLWASVEAWLRKARELLVNLDPRSGEYVDRFEEYLAHNELELALDALSEAAELAKQSQRFWDAMIQAAKLMELAAQERLFVSKWAEAGIRLSSKNDG